MINICKLVRTRWDCRCACFRLFWPYMLYCGDLDLWPFNVILPKIAEPYTTHPNHFKLSIITQHSMVRILHKQRFLSIYGLVVTLAFELLTSESSVHFCPQVYEICKFGEISRPGVYKRSLSLNRWMIRCTDRQTNPKR